MTDTKKFILCVDFDGVLHSYASGWQGADAANDPPVPGAIEWLERITASPRFEVNIYSSRSKEPGGIMVMVEWLVQHGLSQRALKEINFPTQKPAASLLIDDRAFVFNGHFPDINWMLAYKPWNKLPEPKEPMERVVREYQMPSQDRLDEMAAHISSIPYTKRSLADHYVGQLLHLVRLLRRSDKLEKRRSRNE